MVSLKQDALLLSLRPVDGIRLVPEASDRRAWERMDSAYGQQLIARAERALREEIHVLRPGALGADPEGFARVYIHRRELAKSLALGVCASGSARYAERLADLIYLISEESDWSLTPGSGGFADFMLRVIDVNACETGSLLALMLTLCRTRLDALSPLIASRVQWEVERRLIEPLIMREGEVLKIEDGDTPRAVAAMLTAVMLLETEDRRRWMAIRRLLRMLEAHLNERGEAEHFSYGLEKYLERAMAINDCFALLGEASGGEVELRDEALFTGMARVFVDSYIGAGYFVNPGGLSMKPMLSPGALFCLGEAARFTPLCALAAVLNRMERAAEPMFTAPTPSLLQQVMDCLSRDDLMREPAREICQEKVDARGYALLAARMEGFFCSISGSGDVTLFYKGEPVLVSAGRGETPRSVPLVNGREQARPARPGMDIELREGPGYSMLSMDIAGAYPREARLQCWQRTAMLAPFEGGVRLMDVFDFDGAPGRVAFRFVSAIRPIEEEEGLMRLGPVSMSFDARLEISVSPVAAGAHLLTLAMPDGASGGNYAFVFRPLR